MTQDDRRLLGIVDDEDDLREFISSIVQDLGYATVDFANPNDLLTYVKDNSKQKLTAVLSDINMPTMSGLDLLTKIRGIGLRTPFAFLTGNQDAESVVRAVRLGASDFLFKPCKPDEISLVVERTLNLGARILETEALLTQLKVKNPHLAKDIESIEQASRFETLGKALNSVKRAS